MTLPPLRALGYLACMAFIFVMGGITGWLAGSHPPLPLQQQQHEVMHIREKLKNRLDLTPGQLREVDPIILDSAKQLRVIRIEAMHRTDAIFEAAFSQINSHLTPAQQAKLEKLREERRAMMLHRMEEWRHGPGDDDGPRQQGEWRHPPGDPGHSPGQWN